MADKTKKQNSAAYPSKGKQYILDENSPFAVKEAYKTLRTNVLFSIPGNECKIIGVTSAEAHEGKSTNAINLAISLSQIGKRVLITECDLRLPTFAKKLRIKPAPGLTNILVGEVPVSEALHRVNGIDVIASGSIPKEPTGLLESKHIMALFEKLKEYYDYIIIDTPPVNQVADAVILSKLIDGFVLVVNHDSSRYKEVKSAISSLGIAKANIIGFVYNNAEIANKKYYKKNYGYGV